MNKFAAFALTFAAAAGVTAVTATAASAVDDRPVVYLTFDDGLNDSGSSGQVLDTLAQYDAKSTFFVLGQSVLARPEMARRVVDEGHAIGNHSWSHQALTGSGDGGAYNSLLATNNVVLNATGVQMSCYRPPYGATNKTVHATAVSLGLTNEGWTAAYKAKDVSPHAGGWDIDSRDFERNNARTMSELNSIQGGEVVLMHDIHQSTANVFSTWMASNASRFDFQPLPGCGAEVSEPEMDAAAPEAWYRFQVARLYSAYFERYPDAAGWEYWNTEFVHGTDLFDMSNYFTESDEFRTAYGSAVTDSEFVELVYNNVMDRSSDEVGKAYWLSELAKGMTHGEMMVFFSESAEFTVKSGPTVTGGCWNSNVVASYGCAAPGTPGWIE